jgi:hypothetical protein
MLTGKTPDITPAQIAAILTFVVGQAVAFGLVNQTRAQTLISVGSIIVAAAWKLADAYLRGHRAAALAPPKA